MTGARRPALASALLLLASLPPSPLPWLVFVALVPWARTARTLPPAAAARSGAWLFALFWGPALAWIPQAGLRVGLWTLAGWAAVVLTLTLLGALFGWTFAHLHRGARWPLPAALAGAWVGLEVLRGSALGPLSFSWLGLALPLTTVPEWIQGAAWVGEAGLALGIALVNGHLAATIDASRRRVALVLGGWILGMAIVTWGGAWRIARGAPVDLGSWVVVQPSVPLAERRGPTAFERSVAAVDSLLEAARDAANASNARAVLLPETVLEGPRQRIDPVLVRWQATLGVPLVAGVERRSSGQRTNSVVLVTADGVWARSDKIRLVPGVEWAPGSREGWHAGRPAILPVPGAARLAPLVCIESASAQPARALVRSGADLLVNVTNDAWLAEAPAWTWSPAFEQHPAHLALRAVELGRGALRVANNGHTEVVDPWGRRTPVLEPHAPGVAVVRGTRLAHDTLHARLGWWLRWVVLGCTATGLLVALRPVDPTRRLE